MSRSHKKSAWRVLDSFFAQDQAGKTHVCGHNARATERTGHLGGLILARHSAFVLNTPLSARFNAPNGHLLGVLEKFAENAEQQPTRQAQRAASRPIQL